MLTLQTHKEEYLDKINRNKYELFHFYLLRLTIVDFALLENLESQIYS